MRKSTFVAVTLDQLLTILRAKWFLFGPFVYTLFICLASHIVGPHACEADIWYVDASQMRVCICLAVPQTTQKKQMAAVRNPFRR